MTAHEMPTSCLNCDATLTGPYCAACGQHVTPPDPTLRELLHEATHELTHLDGKLPKTLNALFLHPGQLTRDVLAGRRTRWIPPLRLYLICSLAFFLIGPIAERFTHAPSAVRFSFTDETRKPSTTLTPAARADLATSPIGRLFGVGRLERAAQNLPAINQLMRAAFPKAMFILLPVFAALTSIAWRRERRRYPAHMYLALHLHAAWFGTLAIGTLVAAVLPRIGPVVGVLSLLYMVAYSVVTLRRVFGESWPRTILKSVGVTATYLVCLVIATILLLGYAILEM